MADTPPLLAADRLCRLRPEADGWMLDGVSMVLPPGSRVALTGPSGSGKTLLLRALAMLDPVDGGRLLWRGQPIARAGVPAFRSQVIYLHQRPAIMGDSVERLVAHWFEAAPDQRAFCWVTHDQRQASRMTDSTLHMAGGRLTGPGAEGVEDTC